MVNSASIKRAIDDFDEATKRAPQIVGAYFSRGYNYLTLEQYELAVFSIQLLSGQWANPHHVILDSENI